MQYEHFVIKDFETGKMAQTNKLILQQISPSEIKTAVLKYYMELHLGASPLDIFNSMKKSNCNVYHFITTATKDAVSIDTHVVDTMFSNLNFISSVCDFRNKKQVYCFDADFL